MSSTTDQANIQWNYEVYGAFESPAPLPEPGSLDDMAISQAKLFDHTAQVAELEEIYRNNTSTSPIISPSQRDDDSHISPETISEPPLLALAPSLTKPPIFLAGYAKNIPSRHDYGYLTAVSPLIVRDYETPLPAGQVRECAQWLQPIGGYGEPIPEGAMMDPRVDDGSADASRALQSEGTPDDQSPPQPPSAGLTINDPLSLTPVSSPPSSAPKPTSPSRKPARKQIHKCQGCTHKYDRISRAQACLNRHNDEKPHGCEGGCGKTECDMSFISEDRRRSHTKAPCLYCSRPFSKGNIAKHQKRCPSRSASSVPGPSNGFHEERDE